jgi:hypothetical protein
VTDPRALLDRLLALYWLEGVSAEVAAGLLNIRKADFLELADLRLVERGLQRAAMRYYRRAFNRQFPRCDAKAWAHAKHATAKRKPCSHSREPTRRDVELVTPPQRHSLRELVPSPRCPDGEVLRYLAVHPVPLHRRFADPPQTGTENEVAEVKYG